MLPFHWRERPSVASLEICTPHERLLVTLTLCSADVAVTPGTSDGHAKLVGKLADRSGASLSAMVCAFQRTLPPVTENVPVEPGVLSVSAATSTSALFVAVPLVEASS